MIDKHSMEQYELINNVRSKLKETGTQGAAGSQESSII